MEELIRVTQLPVIEERLQKLKAEITEKTAQAMSFACTDESLTVVKSIRADLSKEFAAYELQRKAVKTAIMTPYERFEAVYKECVSGPFKTADAALKQKITATESEIKQRCEEDLKEYFRELCSAEHVDWLTFEQSGIKVDMSSAKAKTPKKLREQLAAFVVKVSQDVTALADMECADELLVEYKRTLDISTAIGTVKERHRRMEEEKAAQEARKTAQAQEQACAAKVEAAAPPIAQEPPKEAEKAFRCTFTVTATKPQLVKLKEFLTKEGIQYE